MHGSRFFVYPNCPPLAASLPARGGTPVTLSAGAPGAIAFAGLWWLAERADLSQQEKQKKYAHIKWRITAPSSAKVPATDKQGVTYFKSYDDAKKAYDSLTANDNGFTSYELCRAGA